jgi:hypothetical protein
LQDKIIQSLMQLDNIKSMEIEYLKTTLVNSKAEIAQLKKESTSKLSQLKESLKALYNSIPIETTTQHSPLSAQIEAVPEQSTDSARTEAKESKSSIALTSILQAAQHINSPVHFQYNSDPVGIAGTSGCERNYEQKAYFSVDDKTSKKKKKRQRTKS